MQFCYFSEHSISSKYWQKSYSREKSFFSPFRSNDKTAISSHYDISSSRVLQNEKNGILRVDVLRGSLALCVWKVAKTIITIPITLRVGLVTWKNINSCIRWYYHLKNSQNVTFNEFSNIFSLPNVKMGHGERVCSYPIERSPRQVWKWWFVLMVKCTIM